MAGRTRLFVTHALSGERNETTWVGQGGFAFETDVGAIFRPPLTAARTTLQPMYLELAAAAKLNEADVERIGTGLDASIAPPTPQRPIVPRRGLFAR